MQKQIFFFFLMLIISTTAIYGQDAEFCGKREANLFLLGNSKIKKVQWQLLQSYDPYNGGITTPADATHLEAYVFQKNGKMISYATDNQQNGKWKLTKEKEFIWIEYSLIKGKKELYKFKIKELTSEKMVLAIQGRHGLVEKTYLKVKN